jgi:hypothetical protein
MNTLERSSNPDVAQEGMAVGRQTNHITPEQRPRNTRAPAWWQHS